MKTAPMLLVLLALPGVDAVAARSSHLRRELEGQQKWVPAQGPWRGSLEGPGGPIHFGLELQRGGLLWKATLVNGSERRTTERVSLLAGKLVIHIDPYDSRLEAQVSEDGESMSGEWIRYRTATSETRMKFRAEAGAAPAAGALAADRRAQYAGRWRVQFSSSAEPAVGIFGFPGETGELHGTFLTTLGDYRFLAGSVAQGMTLNVFDGAHAFLFRAELQEDGSLRGDFWSRDSWHETWTATKDPDVEMPDPFGLTTWRTGSAPFDELTFPDPNGTQHRLGDPGLRGKATLIVLFGTWCPNCYDQTHYLVELHRRYGPRGLGIVGLAFEFGDDFERQARVVRRYAEHHGAKFPILIAGTSDKEKAGEAFPLLDRVRAYPTTVFLDNRTGNVEAIYTGFSGPATGSAHEHLRERFEALIEGMLEEGER